MSEQDKRAVETMASMGCELETLYRLFAKMPRKDVEAVWREAKRKREEFLGGKASINCS